MTIPRSRRDQGRPAAPGSADPTAPPDPGPRTPEPDAVHGAELAAVRTGDDTRRRGWFWHWNSIVTQYAPLIGLKGVGLLNSYTVWTDRRESSPMRGYAFPSQQSEADFYGEDRAELIAINKILVALDLIEIKKEMVLRVDEQGHRWRVPHNLYRVKDTDDSRGLTTADVLRVTELAERDAAVYRYLRRVFSARFAPIDPANVWHAILPEVRQDPAWQRLAAKTAREEERFSARSKAGHASRRAGAAIAAIDDDIAATGTDAFHAPATGDTPTAETTPNDTGAVVPTTARTTSVAVSNDGSGPDVGPTNRGLGASPTIVGATAVGPINRGRPTDVAPSNTIEDLSTTTTTTTFGADENDEMTDEAHDAQALPLDNIVHLNRPVTGPKTPVTAPVTTSGPALSQADGHGTRGDEEPETGDADEYPTARVSSVDEPGRGHLEPTVASDDADWHGRASATGEGDPIAATGRAERAGRAGEHRRQDEALALTAFEAANGGRVATPAEVQILRHLAGQLDAHAAADPELSTGWAWIGAAIYEAVDAGSAYVAPRRIREIVSRWQREGRPGVAAAPTDDRSTELPAAVRSTLTSSRRGDDPDGATDRRPRAGRTDAPSPDGPRSSGDEPGAATAGTPSGSARRGSAAAGGDADGPVAEVVDGGALWEAVLRELARDLGLDRLAELAGAVVVTHATTDVVEIAAPPTVAAALGGAERPLLTRALSAVLHRTVRLTIRPLPAAPAGHHVHSAEPPPVQAGTEPAFDRDAPSEPAATIATAPISAELTGPAPIPAATEGSGAGLGLSDAHLWAGVVDEVARSGDVTPADVSAWLRPARIAGRTPAGAYVVAAPSAIARRRLDGPLRPALETALTRVLGPGATFEVASVTSLHSRQ